MQLYLGPLVLSLSKLTITCHDLLQKHLLPMELSQQRFPARNTDYYSFFACCLHDTTSHFAYSDNFESSLPLKGVSNTSLLSKGLESCSNHKSVLLLEHAHVKGTVGKRKVHLIQWINATRITNISQEEETASIFIYFSLFPACIYIPYCQH